MILAAYMFGLALAGTGWVCAILESHLLRRELERLTESGLEDARKAQLRAWNKPKALPAAEDENDRRIVRLVKEWQAA